MKQRPALFLTDYILCIVLSLAFSAAPYYIQQGTCHITLAYAETCCGYFFIFLICAFIFRTILLRGSNKSFPPKIISFWESLMSKPRPFILPVVMMSVWLPALVSLYPGTLINDTWGQLKQYILFTGGMDVLNDWQPFFDTLLMGVLIVPMAKLIGRWHVVIFFYVLVQSLMTALVFSYAVIYSYRKLKIGPTASFNLFLFYCLLPLYPASAQNVSKDALFSWIFTLFFIDYLEIIRSDGTAFYRKSFLLRLIILSVLCVLTKKIGFYVVVFSFITLFFFLGKSKKQIGCAVLCVLICGYGVMPALRSALDIIPGGKQEIFSIPFQQTARYVKEHSAELTEEEYSVIDRLLDMSDLAERYVPANADPVKGYRERGENEDYLAYLKVWVHQGFRHPKTYLAAFNAMAAGWFSFEDCIPLMNMDHHTQLDTRYIPGWVSERDWSYHISEAYSEMLDNLYSNPFVRPLLSCGLYTSLIPAFALSSTIGYKRGRPGKQWLGVLPILFSIVLGCWLAPLAVPHFEAKRYLFPLTYTAPLTLAWCSFSLRNTADIAYRDQKSCCPGEEKQQGAQNCG